MTLTCITKAPDRWKCAVDIFDRQIFSRSVIQYLITETSGVIELVETPDVDKEMLYERSPINFVDTHLPVIDYTGEERPGLSRLNRSDG
jgi:dipeptidyl aminopeptidase/acylaminoacyl peptidase